MAFPMVATLQELDAARRLLQQAWQEVQEEKQTSAPMPQLGMILEVPAPLLNLEGFLQRVDFISVGSNDLLQFLLAVDRNNQRVNGLYSHFQPALLQALKRVVGACQKADVALHLCGEMAADPLAAALLVGMG
ncbi:MAG: phosphoenolpyruvate-protein phosphotransferase PtsP, partial [Deltaproteobacteria bacterium]